MPADRRPVADGDLTRLRFWLFVVVAYVGRASLVGYYPTLHAVFLVVPFASVAITWFGAPHVLPVSENARRRPTIRTWWGESVLVHCATVVGVPAPLARAVQWTCLALAAGGWIAWLTLALQFD